MAFQGSQSLTEMKKSHLMPNKKEFVWRSRQNRGRGGQGHCSPVAPLTKEHQGNLFLDFTLMSVGLLDAKVKCKARFVTLLEDEISHSCPKIK